MEGRPRVKRLRGEGTGPGYRTRNALGAGHQRRGLLYHRLFSSAAGGSRGESAEARAALAPLTAEATRVFDAGFDDVAVWATAWTRGHRRACRVQQRDRLVCPAAGQPACHLYGLAPRLRPLARVEAELVARKGAQPRPTLQPVTAVVAAVPLAVASQEEVRSRADGARHDRPVWLVEVRLGGRTRSPGGSSPTERPRPRRRRWRPSAWIDNAG